MFEKRLTPQVLAKEETNFGDILVTSPNSDEFSLAEAVASHLSEKSKYLFRVELDGIPGRSCRPVVNKIILDPVDPTRELSLLPAAAFSSVDGRIVIATLGMIGFDSETREMLNCYLDCLRQGTKG